MDNYHQMCYSKSKFQNYHIFQNAEKYIRKNDKIDFMFNLIKIRSKIRFTQNLQKKNFEKNKLI